MNNYEVLFWCLGALIISFSIWTGLVFLARKRLGRPPVSEKMLRPPGESLRIEIEKQDDKAVTQICVFMFINAIVGILFRAAFKTMHQSALVALIFALPAVALMYFAIRALLKTAIKYGNYNLGFHGERVVGEYLNKLMLDGCEVFHDLQAGERWNIDHIIVSPRGVFAVETKTRRKPDGDEGHKVTFTGTDLQYPTWTDRYGLKQAAENSRWLADFLSKSTGEPVKVAPILTLPGWMVNRIGKNTISVLNPKEIRARVLDAQQPQLDPSQFRRICHQLDQKCRNVDL